MKASRGRLKLSVPQKNGIGCAPNEQGVGARCTGMKLVRREEDVEDYMLLAKSSPKAPNSESTLVTWDMANTKNALTCGDSNVIKKGLEVIKEKRCTCGCKEAKSDTIHLRQGN